MPLIRLQDGRSQWPDIKDAVKILWLASFNPDISVLRKQLGARYPNVSLSATDLHTGTNGSRRAFLVARTQNITIAFEGSGLKQLCTTVFDSFSPSLLVLGMVRRLVEPLKNVDE
jgi:hypothetical protein